MNARIFEHRTLAKLVALTTRYDVFISYRHADAHRYAVALESALKAKGLLVFRDESEEDAGASLDTFVKRACASRSFVILVTRETYASGNVLAELSAYLDRRIQPWLHRPFSKVIPINFGGALSAAPVEPFEWSQLVNHVYLNEDSSALNEGRPADAVVERIARSAAFTRSWFWFSFLSGLVAAAVIIAVGAASAFLGQTLGQLADASNSLGAQEVQLMASKYEAGALSSEIATAKQELEQVGTKLTELNGKLADASVANEALRRDTERLAEQREVLEMRAAALVWIGRDPLIAYRLAEAAYVRVPDPDNRKLLLQAVSMLDLLYQDRIVGYSAEAIAEPYVLLRASDERNSALLVYDMRNGRRVTAPFRADQAWIVPEGEDSWRFLAKEWYGAGVDAVPRYRLLDSAGSTLGDVVTSRAMTAPRFLSPGEVVIEEDTRSSLRWNLLTGARETHAPQDGDDGDGYFARIYGPLDTRADGFSAAHNRNGLVLADADGRINPASYSDVEFDPSAFFSTARWAPDGAFLALDYFDRKRLGIWDPARPRFTWLDPEGWVVDAYAWSRAGHVLAFAGRTANQVDVTVETVRADSPEDTRTIIERSDVPIRAVAFIPDDRRIVIADRDGQLRLLDATSGAVLGRGLHHRLDRLFGSRYGVYSSGSDDFRVWNTASSPAAAWTFASTAARTYGAIGAADARWSWLAVPYHDQDTAGVELRDVRTGSSQDVQAPRGGPMAVRLSPDARWLAAMSATELWVYDLNTWMRYEFPLLAGDHQYFTLVLTDNDLRARVLGTRYWDDSKNQLDYVVKLDPTPTFVERSTAFGPDESGEPVDLASRIAGWNLGNLYRYRSAGTREVASSGWAYSAKCRDQALGARDCDVQFVPLDIPRLLALYDGLTWRPDRAELRDLARAP